MLNPNDVECSRSASVSSHGSFERATQDRTERLTLRHKPTGLEVAASFGPARLSKGAWQKKRAEMEKQLTAELELLVKRKGK